MSWLVTAMTSRSPHVLKPYIQSTPLPARPTSTRPNRVAIPLGHIGGQGQSFDDRMSIKKIPTRSLGWSARLKSRITRLRSTAYAARQWQQAIAELEALDNHILKDIGTHRSHIGSFVTHAYFSD
jgi:uncharacterized protein YjiS (DUF1127 family)